MLERRWGQGGNRTLHDAAWTSRKLLSSSNWVRGVSSENKNDLLHKSLDGFSFSRGAVAYYPTQEDENFQEHKDRRSDLYDVGVHLVERKGNPKSLWLRLMVRPCPWRF